MTDDTDIQAADMMEAATIAAFAVRQERWTAHNLIAATWDQIPPALKQIERRAIAAAIKVWTDIQGSSQGSGNVGAATPKSAATKIEEARARTITALAAEVMSSPLTMEDVFGASKKERPR